MANKTGSGTPHISGTPDNNLSSEGKMAAKKMLENTSIELHVGSKGSGTGTPVSSGGSDASSSGQQPRNGGVSSGTGGNFVPSSSGGGSAAGGGSGGGGRVDGPGTGEGGEAAGDQTGGQSVPPGTQEVNRDKGGNESPHPNQSSVRPEEAAGAGAAGDVGGNLRQLESQEGGQPLTNYDEESGKDSDKDKAGNDGKRKPWQRRTPGKHEKQDDKGTSKLKLKAAEKANTFKQKTGMDQLGMNGKIVQGLKSKIGKKVKKKAWKYAAGGVGIGGAFFLLMLIMFLLGTLLIPHFVSNMMSFEFVRLTRTAYESTEEVVKEQTDNNALKGTPQGEAEAAKYDGAADVNADGDNTFDQLTDELTVPAMDEVEKAEVHSNDFTENGEEVDGVDRLVSVTEKDPDSNASTVLKVTGETEDGQPGTPNIMEGAGAEDVATDVAQETGQFNPATGDSEFYSSPDNQRNVIESQDEAATDDGGAEAGDEGDNVTTKQAEANLEDQIVEKTQTNEAAGSGPLAQENTDSENASEMLEADMQNPAEVDQVVAEDGNLPNNLVNLINADFVQNALDKVAAEIGDFLNPASGKLIPVCIVYDGSKFNGLGAQAQSTEDQRTAVMTMAIADQQKRGSPYFTANLAGAENWKLDGDPRAGGVTRSIPIEENSGEKVSTTSQLSAEGAPLGNLANSGNILSALGVPFAGPLSGALDTICPAITNIWVNLGLGALNLTFLVISTIFTGPAGDGAEAGLETAAEGGADAAAEAVTEEITDQVVDASVSDASSSGLSVAKDFGKGVIKLGKKTIIQGGLIAMATFLAKFIVLYQSGIFNSGIATGQQYDDAADQGTNVLTNAMVANGYGGRPLTNTEALQVQQDDSKTLAEVNATQSTYQRYLALSNPQSLASVLTDRVAINLNYGFFSSVMADIGNIFNPASLLPQVFFGGISGQANAASSIDTEDYGDVQQGYSDAEYALIAREPSYQSPSQNQYMLNQSGDESQIAQTYGPCFTESVALLLSTDTNGVPDIVRDANGNVSQTQGLCSPQNLGPNNPQYGDLVFRYRLSLGYDTTINLLEGLAYANNTNATLQ